ncbi:MAG: tRNA (guanosine(46)-N7)-methyltransferase TrmB [Longicatena sp.]|nr:tRNA (guanosine(46)-N7)-methyltransferase TrmB [Longicatena sp.]
MRMRNLPWAKDYLNEHDVVIKDAEQKAGSWKQFLNCDVLHVEIGTGKGDYWTKMSSMYPQFGWIGIEKNTSVAALAVKKYDGLENKNSHMAFIQEDAADISKWFGEKEIDVIHLNFSDPWPKKRAHKKRLSSDSFIKMYDQVLADDGEIQMKTDNEQLFEFSILAFQNAGWKLIDFTVNYRRDQHDEDAITEYETRFMNLGQPIFRAVWKR